MKKFKYNGVRKNKIGYIKEFSNEKLTPEKLERLKFKILDKKVSRSITANLIEY